MTLGALYTGICTPTEVGALGAFLAGVFGIFFGHLKWVGIEKALKGTIRTTAMIFMILIGTFIFSSFMTLSGFPQKIITVVGTMEINRWVIILGIAISYFIISMFMDELPLLLITLQLTFPLIVFLKFDPIWYGIFSMLLVMMGLVFPPVGMICFVVSAASKIPLHKVYKGTSILMIAIILTTILIFIWPEIVLWLPATMKR
jgi:TRAP-type C4-dicarboxylate transport system permease large subunit